LDGPLGQALSGALLATDLVYVYVPTNGGWHTFECSGTGAGFTQTDPAVGGEGTGITITPTTAVFIDHVATGQRSPARLTAYDTPQQPGTKVPIYGSDNGGWTPLSVPFGVGTTTLSALSLPSPQTGDQVWIKKISGGYEIPIYYASGWLRGRTPVDPTLVEGQAFWYRRNAAGDGEWNADAALDVN